RAKLPDDPKLSFTSRFVVPRKLSAISSSANLRSDAAAMTGTSWACAPVQIIADAAAVRKQRRDSLGIANDIRYIRVNITRPATAGKPDSSAARRARF